MKKSTILLLLVVYILSFFVIGLLGNSVRSYDPVYEPESIELYEPDGKTFLASENGPITDSDGNVFDYWFVYAGYVPGSVVRIQAAVKPDNSTYPNVTFMKDAQNTSFTLDSYENNPDIDENFALVYLNEELNEDVQMIAAKFTIMSQNPGVRIKVKACIVFAL